jgi:hypothetical protein
MIYRAQFVSDLWAGSEQAIGERACVMSRRPGGREGAP